MSKKPKDLSEATLEKVLTEAAKRGPLSLNPTHWIATPDAFDVQEVGRYIVITHRTTGGRLVRVR